MTKNVRRMLSILMALVMIVGHLPDRVNAADRQTPGKDGTVVEQAADTVIDVSDPGETGEITPVKENDVTDEPSTEGQPSAEDPSKEDPAAEDPSAEASSEDPADVEDPAETPAEDPTKEETPAEQPAESSEEPVTEPSTEEVTEPSTEEPTEPAEEPTQPSAEEPTQPVENPTEPLPTEPTDPIVPVETLEPTDPTNPVKPVTPVVNPSDEVETKDQTLSAKGSPVSIDGVLPVGGSVTAKLQIALKPQNIKGNQASQQGTKQGNNVSTEKDLVSYDITIERHHHR